MIFTPKNKAILSQNRKVEPHALVTYRARKPLHSPEIFEEIAIGQTVGAWDERYVSAEVLQQQVAKVMHVTESHHFFEATLAFPYSLWNGDLSWLLTLIFGKMSFYQGVTLTAVEFEKGCLSNDALIGPQTSFKSLRERVGVNSEAPLLMGILKPNVAMSAASLADLYAEVGDAGVHLVKDDEIRHDANFNLTLKRVEVVAQRKARDRLNTLYVVHAPVTSDTLKDPENWSRQLESAGADALLVNVWTCGLGVFQRLRRATKLPLVAHPALAGALGQGTDTDAIAPAVLLGTLVRAAGADLTLFPSPYGKIGLPLKAALALAEQCRTSWHDDILQTIPVPSAGIKPEHVEAACRDFGTDFILNAGTAIFASGVSVADSAKEFLRKLEASNCEK